MLNLVSILNIEKINRLTYSLLGNPGGKGCRGENHTERLAVIAYLFLVAYLSVGLGVCPVFL